MQQHQKIGLPSSTTTTTTQKRRQTHTRPSTSKQASGADASERERQRQRRAHQLRENYHSFRRHFKIFKTRDLIGFTIPDIRQHSKLVLRFLSPYESHNKQRQQKQITFDRRSNHDQNSAPANDDYNDCAFANGGGRQGCVGIVGKDILPSEGFD